MTTSATVRPADAMESASPLSFARISAGCMWRGSTWTVKDEGKLATMIARVAVGQAVVVERILKETGCNGTSRIAGAGRQGACGLLRLENEATRAHRDGWVFQVISWIASHVQANEKSEQVLVRAPHMRHADKGQDGLLIEYAGKDIARVVVCEDKATEDPRKQIRTKVLPDFCRYETGVRDNELIAAVTSMLLQHRVADADTIAREVMWEGNRAYRVAVTVNEKQARRYATLFNGYDTSVSGDTSRRRVELLRLSDLRTWMDKLAKMALDAIDKDDV